MGSSREEPPHNHVGKSRGERKGEERAGRRRERRGRDTESGRRRRGRKGKASTRLAPRLPNTSKEMCVSLEGAIGVSALTVWDERPRRRSAVPRHSLLPPRCSNEDVHVVNAAPAAWSVALERSLPLGCRAEPYGPSEFRLGQGKNARASDDG